jgi:HSP20 family molecular chaperone IbpA
MHKIIHPTKTYSRSLNAVVESFRNPHFDCSQMGDVVKLVIFVPGVEAAGIEINTRGPDLTVTARKTHFVRINWRALHLENAQRDYQLKLRLGNHLDYTALTAELVDGVLTLLIPKRVAVAEPMKQVA